MNVFKRLATHFGLRRTYARQDAIEEGREAACKDKNEGLRDISSYPHAERQFPIPPTLDTDADEQAQQPIAAKVAKVLSEYHLR